MTIISSEQNLCHSQDLQIATKNLVQQVFWMVYLMALHNFKKKPVGGSQRNNALWTVGGWGVIRFVGSQRISFREGRILKDDQNLKCEDWLQKIAKFWRLKTWRLRHIRFKIWFRKSEDLTLKCDLQRRWFLMIPPPTVVRASCLIQSKALDKIKKAAYDKNTNFAAIINNSFHKVCI